MLTKSTRQFSTIKHKLDLSKVKVFGYNKSDLKLPSEVTITKEEALN